MKNKVLETLGKLETLEYSVIENLNEVAPLEVNEDYELPTEVTFTATEYSSCGCSSGCGSNYNRGDCRCSSGCGNNYNRGDCRCSSGCGNNYSKG